MIGVIPAAGEGKRLGTGVKALTKVRGRYLIEYPLQNFSYVDLKKAVIIQHDEDISSVLGDNWKSIELLYAQQNERRGIAHAIKQAQPLVGNDYMLIVLGDVVYKGSDLGDMVRRLLWMREGYKCLYGMKSVRNKEVIKRSYGFKLSGNVLAPHIIEKPNDVKDLLPFIGLGVYVSTSAIFNYIDKTPVSELRGEVELTDTLHIMAQDLNAIGHILSGFYANINTLEGLKATEKLLGRKRN